MKQLSDLTYLGKLRWRRKLAHEALVAYGLPDSRLTFLCFNGNAIYRVDASGNRHGRKGGDPFLANRYVLRVHMPYHSKAAIDSELQWLTALRRDTDLPVPEPVPTLNGNLSIEVRAGGLPERRYCSLLRWLDGRFLSRKLRPQHVRSWGRLMARLHKHAAAWRLPPGFDRRHRDWEGLFAGGAGFDYPYQQLWENIPDRYREPFLVVTRRLKRLMTKWGRRPDTYGLIHADLAIRTNILFRRGKARAIDFDDCAFGYWIYDLAMGLGQLPRDRDWPWIRDAFLAGYSDVRLLPDEQLKHLELFIAAFNATLLLWMLDSPQWSGAKKAIAAYGAALVRYTNSA